MTSIQDALTSIALEKYIEAFLASGFTQLEDLISLSPADLDRTFAEMAMLKGHTFKLKKLIEDAKTGGLPKIPPQQSAVKPPVPKPKQDAPAQSRADPPKPVEANGKDLLCKAGNIKSQCDSILQTRDSLLASLQQFLDLDLEPYFQALNQLKSMQQTVREMVPPDVEMTN